MDWFLVTLSVFALLTGISRFVPNETLATIAAVSGIIAGVLGLVAAL